MAHQHAEDETYFLDQICMVALSGAFGVICLCLYFLQQGMLNRLLGPQFHPYVLASGAVLVVIAVLRAGLLWSQAGAKGEHAACCPDEHDHGHAHDADSHAHSHSHGEAHSHSHAHGDAGHDHAHAVQVLASSPAFGHTPAPAPSHSHAHGDPHAHSHAPAHSHAHSHSHGDGNHSHGWAPWRYVVLLVPIIFFLLGLPSKGPSIDSQKLRGINTERDFLEDTLFAVTQTTLSGDLASALSMIGARQADAISGEAEQMNVKRLEELASNPADRDYYKNKVIRVRGQYMPQSDRAFFLVRFRIQCCAADAIQLSIPIIAKDSITHVSPQAWVEVTGRVDFRQDSKGDFRTAVVVSNRSHVVPCHPDLNPYVQ